MTWHEELIYRKDLLYIYIPTMENDTDCFLFWHIHICLFACTAVAWPVTSYIFVSRSISRLRSPCIEVGACNQIKLDEHATFGLVLIFQPLTQEAIRTVSPVADDISDSSASRGMTSPFSTVGLPEDIPVRSDRTSVVMDYAAGA